MYSWRRRYARAGLEVHPRHILVQNLHFLSFLSSLSWYFQEEPSPNWSKPTLTRHVYHWKRMPANPHLFKIKGVTRKCCQDLNNQDISVLFLSLFIPKTWSLEIFVCYAASKNVQERSFQNNPQACEVVSLGKGMCPKPDNLSWTQTHAHSWINAFKMWFTRTIQMVFRLQKGATRLLGEVLNRELLLVESSWDQARRAAGIIGTVEIRLGCFL